MNPAADSPQRSNPTWLEIAKHVGFLTVLALFLVWGGRQVMPWNKMFPDFISFWAAGKIIVLGQSPYDVTLQTNIQRAYGWDKATDGFGLYDFLPYYYPPWLGFLWVGVLPLGFEAGKLVSFFLNVEMALLAAYLLNLTIRGIPGWAPYVFVSCSLFTLATIILGQSSILVFFLTALAWMLLERHWDRAGGFVLAWLSVKPQLTVLLIGAVLVWLIRQKRYTALISFLITSGLLVGISSLMLPGWLADMFNALRITPPPTEHYPWIGNTWFLVLRSMGLEGAILWTCYLAVTVPILGILVKAAATKKTPIESVVGLGVLAAFFVAPYARHYDFPVLVIPLLLMAAKWLSAPARTDKNVHPTLLWGCLIVGFVIVPYVQMMLLAHLKEIHDPGGKFLVECSYFWVPTLILIGWLFLMRRPPSATPSMAAKAAQVA